MIVVTYYKYHLVDFLLALMQMNNRTLSHKHNKHFWIMQETEKLTKLYAERDKLTKKAEKLNDKIREEQRQIRLNQ